MSKFRRNQSIECCRLLAALAVVFIHIPFPGELGSLINCLFRVAVPFFFAVSGFFSWGTDVSRLRKKAISILKLYVWAVILSLGWGAFCQIVVHGTSPLPWLLEKLHPKYFVRLLILQMDFLGGGHLWYLASLLVCYVVLAWYVHKKGTDYRLLYLFSGMMLLITLALETIVKAAGIHVQYYLYRNAWLFGLPLFTLGLFLGQYREKLRENPWLSGRKLRILFLLGTALSALQWIVLGKLELPLGALVQVFSLILMATDAPNLAKTDSLRGQMIGYFGSVSATIYITHLILAEFYLLFLCPGITPWLGSIEAYVRPLIIAALSLGTGVLWVLVKSGIKKLLPSAK